MRKYHMSGVEHVHMMRRVPRSYDMTRTHIMHQGVNKHVDVVLRCSPKHWKKKKVQVNPVKGEKKKDAVHIRVHAAKGYVAVRKVTNEKYEADRRKVVTAYETKYGAPSAGNRALVHDMRSQLSSMAKRSADYIDTQLGAAQTPAAAVRPQTAQQQTAPKTEAPLPAFPTLPNEMGQNVLSPETEAILKQGGYKRPKATPTNPYASDYLRQASDEEFRSLMDSLERSLDRACDKYVVDTSADTSQPSEAAASADSDFSVGVVDNREIYADPAQELPQDDAFRFEPALRFSEGGEHYIPQDDLFDRHFDTPYTDDTAPKEGGFDASRYFSEEEQTYLPPQTDFDRNDDFTLPTLFADEDEETVLPTYKGDGEPAPYIPYPDEDEVPYVPPMLYTKEEEFVPPAADDEDDDYPVYSTYPEDDGYTASQAAYPEDDGYAASQAAYPEDDGYAASQATYPEDDGYTASQAAYPEDDGYSTSQAAYPEDDGYTPSQAAYPEDDGYAASQAAYPEDDEEMAPPTIFPDDEEEFVPPMIFPDEDEYVPAPESVTEDSGYSPAPVSPDRNEVWEDGTYSTTIQTPNARQTETFFSRTGGQLKKAIGVIRGTGHSSAKNSGSTPHRPDGDIEITYSDRNG